MTDIIISANNESSLLQSLYKFQVVDPFTYYSEANYANIAKNIIEIQPQSSLAAPLANKVQIFKVPRYGLIKKSWVKSTITVGANEAAALDNTRTGSRLFSDITLRTSSQVLWKQTPPSCESRLRDQPVEKALVVNRWINTTATLAADTNSGSFYVPLFCPFFERPEMYIDTSFVEPLELHLTVNTTAGTGASTALSAMTNVLYIEYVDMQESVKRAYQSSNFGQSNKLNMLIYNTYDENPTTLTTATTYTVDLKCPQVVFATHCFAHGAVNIGPGIANSRSISTLKMTLTGRSIYETIDAKILEICGSDYHKNSLAVTNAGVPTTGAGLNVINHVSLYHGIKNNRFGQMGAIYLNQTNGPQITIVYSGATTAGEILEITHEYWTLVQIGQDGRMYLGNSL